MSKVYFHLGDTDRKVIHRVKKLLSNEKFKLVLMPGGSSAIEVEVKGNEDLQRVRELSKKMPPKVTLSESYTQSIIESETVAKAIQILLEKRMEWSLNTLALDLMAGRDGDLVIDGKDIWIFSDSEESLRRVMLDIMYDERYHVEFKRDFKVIKKYPTQPPQHRESHSHRAHLDFKLTDEDIAHYREFPSTKHFFFKNEYKHWF
jgi:hypothetical protein